MIKIISAAATALLLTGVAAPAMAQSWMSGWDSTTDWSGPYIGVFGSATKTNDQDDERLRFDRNLDGNFGDTVTTAAAADAFSPGSCDGSPNGNVPSAGCDGDAERLRRRRSRRLGLPVRLLRGRCGRRILGLRRRRGQRDLLLDHARLLHLRRASSRTWPPCAPASATPTARPCSTSPAAARRRDVEPVLYLQHRQQLHRHDRRRPGGRLPGRRRRRIHAGPELQRHRRVSSTPRSRRRTSTSASVGAWRRPTTRSS